MEHLVLGMTVVVNLPGLICELFEELVICGFSLSAEKHLSKFFSDTRGLSPEERGKHLETDSVSW